MAWIHRQLAKLSRQGYPDARSFNYPYGGILDRLHKALSVSEGRAYDAAISILNSMIPDNTNFTASDATDWERRLAIFSKGSAVPLADRKAHILQKMAYPGTTAPRGNVEFLQEQLRAAGFDVYVYENRFDDGMGGYETRTPSEILGVPAGDAEYGIPEYGDIEYGDTWADDDITLCVNYLEADKDADFVIGSTYRNTFYIAGDPITSFANVSIERQEEFRQMILQLKYTQMVGILFINYV